MINKTDQLSLLVLVSALNADVKKLAESINLKSDCLIVNQCNQDNEYTLEVNNQTVIVIESSSRGLSISRNIATKRALSLNYDILLYADDDVIYKDNYVSLISSAYNLKKEADLLAFEINRINFNSTSNNFSDSENTDILHNILPARSFHEYFGSVKISVRSDFLRHNPIVFNETFGTGSNNFTHGEDSIFIRDCRKNGAHIYKTKSIIADVDFSESTWRNVSPRKIFFDKGALWKELSPYLYWLFGFKLVFGMCKEYSYSFIKGYFDYLSGSRYYSKHFSNKQ